jgi:hypothetical protein
MFIALAILQVEEHSAQLLAEKEVRVQEVARRSQTLYAENEALSDQMAAHKNAIATLESERDALSEELVAMTAMTTEMKGAQGLIEEPLLGEGSEHVLIAIESVGQVQEKLAKERIESVAMKNALEAVETERDQVEQLQEKVNVLEQRLRDSDRTFGEEESASGEKQIGVWERGMLQKWDGHQRTVAGKERALRAAHKRLLEETGELQSQMTFQAKRGHQIEDQERQAVHSRLCETDRRLADDTLGEEERAKLLQEKEGLLLEVALLSEALEADYFRRSEAQSHSQIRIAALCAQIETLTAERFEAVESATEDLRRNNHFVEDYWGCRRNSTKPGAPTDSAASSCNNPCRVQ